MLDIKTINRTDRKDENAKNYFAYLCTIRFKKLKEKWKTENLAVKSE